MSSSIIYHETCLRLPAGAGGNCEDLYVHVGQVGSSNCYESTPRGNGRRARAWEALSFGNARQVLTRQIELAGSAEGGSLKVGSASKCTTPESMIRKMRSLLRNAATTDLRDGQTFKDGRVGLIAEWREDAAPGAPRRTTSYDLRDVASCTAFVQRYQALGDEVEGTWNYFRAYGPELR